MLEWLKEYKKMIDEPIENDKKMKELLDKFMKNSNVIM